VLCGTGGRARVESVADHVGWSRRHLAARFQGEFGLAPKRLARVARFQRARALIDARLPLAIAAAEAGYADQSHLNRDWRALAGRTPTQAAEDFPIVQAGSARPAAQWRP
jgi:transcriptional regulator GlxA family with amidase domain